MSAPRARRYYACEVWRDAVTTARRRHTVTRFVPTTAAVVRCAAAYRIHQLCGRSQRGALSFPIVCGRLPLLPWANTAAHCPRLSGGGGGGSGGGGGGGGGVFRPLEGGCLERRQGRTSYHWGAVSMAGAVPLRVEERRRHCEGQKQRPTAAPGRSTVDSWLRFLLAAASISGLMQSDQVWSCLSPNRESSVACRDTFLNN